MAAVLKSVPKVESFGALADRLGVIQATMAQLKAEESSVKSLLRASGMTEVEGDLFRVTISAKDAPFKVDHAAIIEELARKAGIGERALANLFAKHTTEGKVPEPTVACKAKQGKES